MLRAGGVVSHNYLMFYPAAIETALNAGDRDAVERYAAALEDYTRPEPLPLIDLCIARGRALAEWAGGRRDAASVERLERLRAEALRTGLRAGLPAIEAALAGATEARGSALQPRASA